MKPKKTLKIFGLLIAMIFISACFSEKKTFLNEFKEGNSKMLVCSVHVLTNEESTYDESSAVKIVDFINEKSYAKAEYTDLLPPANNEWRINEAKILTESIKLFIDYINTQNIETDTYILYVEFLKSGETPSVWAVHYCLLNNEGKIAMRGLLNSKWEAFQDINPKTNSDCVEVFKIDFEEKMN